jgi:hypothetical protein
MKKSFKLSGLTAALMGLGLASAPIHAEVIFGADVGRSSIGDYEFSATDFNTNQDDSDTAFSVFLGYKWNDFFATTLAYTDLGSLKASGVDGAEGGSGAAFTDKISATALDVSAIGILPFSVFAGEDSFLGRFSLFAQVGMMFWDQDVDCVACDSGSDFKGGDSGTGLLLGGGINVKIIDGLGLHVRYASYPDIGNQNDIDTGHQQDWDYWGVGLNYAIK